MFFLMVTGLLFITWRAVSCAELFVCEGSSVSLSMQSRQMGQNMLWLYNGTQALVVYVATFNEVIVSELYKGRVEFDQTDSSLMLTSLQSRDSGLYTAVMVDRGRHEETVAEYEITVLKPASAPTLTVVSNGSSSDSCNVTLSCTGLNVSLTSICNGTFCSQEGGSRFLSISLNNNTVSCNHSNPVSWRQTTMELQIFCHFYRGDQAPSAGETPCLLRAILLSVALVTMVTAVITVHIREKLHKTD